MATNVYFNQAVRGERNLHEDIVIETIKIGGMDVYYIPREIVEIDTILNEDIISKFTSAFKIEMLLENVDGFEGDGKLLSKFGLEIRDQITLILSVKRWKQCISRYSDVINGASRPREGDLIYFPLSQGMFEIKYVEDKVPFFQLGSNLTFKLFCELFEYGSQEISTGISAVDKVQEVSSETFKVRVEFDDALAHSIGEEVIITLPNAITGSAKVLSYQTDEDYNYVILGALTFDDMSFHILANGTTLVGVDSGAESTISKVFGLDDTDPDIFINDNQSQNSAFEKYADDIINFDEVNPFGEP